jgi:hypothetical protein
MCRYAKPRYPAPTGLPGFFALYFSECPGSYLLRGIENVRIIRWDEVFCLFIFESFIIAAVTRNVIIRHGPSPLPRIALPTKPTGIEPTALLPT